VDLELAGKRVLVTAASSGLGLACATELARAGAQVALCSRSKARAEEAAAGIREAHRANVSAFECDVSDLASLKELFSRTTEALGGLDSLVVNAGGPPPGDFKDTSEEDWSRAFDLTLMSVVRSVQLAVPHLEASGGGSILALASSSVVQPIPNLLLSNVFRPAVRALCKHLSIELASSGIRVNVLSPGRILTPRIDELDAAVASRSGRSISEVRRDSVSKIPLGRLGEPEEFGRIAAVMLSEASSYMTGSHLLVDGGMVRSL